MRDSCKITTGGSKSENEKPFGGADIPGPVGEIVNKAKYLNHVWSYDFLEDRTEPGGKLRILAIIDEYTRECPAIRIAPSIPASVVVEVLENREVFRNGKEAQVIVEIWRQEYNTGV